ncbi:hypothetical protein GQ55_5G194200 [Panicum hallii var. hallii]|uniref:Uncharacterized protein n=1 Tax=Panicum hallii var. hallii TaxID=1504633 RepID=A0A2T7DI03_9POAL|nr:hypothetical protein GQ55_5G194200 [Panicum hallii var. hallii]
MSTFTLCRDVRGHFRIPFLNTMTKMNSRFYHLFQIDVPISSCHFFHTSFLFFLFFRLTITELISF